MSRTNEIIHRDQNGKRVHPGVVTYEHKASCKFLRSTNPADCDCSPKVTIEARTPSGHGAGIAQAARDRAAAQRANRAAFIERMKGRATPGG